MTITIPGTYTAEDHYSAGGVATSKPVLFSPFRTIAKNNNYMWGRYNGALVSATYGSGVSSMPSGGSSADPSAATDLLLFCLPGDAGKRAYQAFIIAEHNDGSKNDGSIHLRINGATVATQAVTAGASTQTYTLSFDNPIASTRDLVVQSSSYYIKIYSLVVCRQRYDSQTITGDATEAPFYFMTDGTERLSATEPVTDEWINRGLNNPQRLVSAQRHSLACLSSPLGYQHYPAVLSSGMLTPYAIGVAGWAGGETQQQPIAVIRWIAKYAQTVSVFSFLEAEAGVTLRIELEPNTIVYDIAPNAATQPASGSTYSHTETTRAVTAGAYICKLFLDGPTTKGGYLRSLQIVGE